jgi:outer membrane protein TolC
VVRAQEMTKVAQRYHELLTELMKNVESAYRHGLKSKNDVLKVQVKLNESELMLRKAENACRLASMNLCHYLGRSLLTTVTVAEGFEELEAEQVHTDGNIVNRPEYEMLNRRVAISQQQVKLNRSELLPKVGVQGAYTYVHGLELNDRTLMDNGSFSILLNVNIPLFHFGERMNKVRAAKAQLEQYQLEQQSQNELMELELAQAQNNLEEARLEREIADRSLQQAEENLRVSGKEYEVGLETLSDHLEAQALWQQAYATQVDARYQCYLQGIAYQKASGRLK